MDEHVLIYGIEFLAARSVAVLYLFRQCDRCDLKGTYDYQVEIEYIAILLDEHSTR